MIHRAYTLARPTCVCVSIRTHTHTHILYVDNRVWCEPLHVYVWVYAHTHTHTYCTWITESDVSPGVGTRHIEPEESRWTKSQDKSIRVSQSIYVCTKYICIHICQAMGWDLGPVAFFLETCDSSEMPRRKMWTWYRELKSTWIWAT